MVEAGIDDGDELIVDRTITPEHYFIVVAVIDGGMAAMDSINQRYGGGTIRPASSGIRKGWDMKRERMTPHYTTNWDDLPIVRA